MENQPTDVNQQGQAPVSAPSTDNQQSAPPTANTLTDQSSGEDVNATDQGNEENRIPHSRVKEMIAKEKVKTREEVKQELLQQFQNSRGQQSFETVQNVPSGQASSSNSEAQRALGLLKGVINEQLEPLKAQAELNHVMSVHKDLPQYKDAMISKMKMNPNLGFEEAYKLAKYDTMANSYREQGRQEAYQSIQSKRSGSAESRTPVNRLPNPNKTVNLWDKSISTAEIEKQINALNEQL